MKFSILFGLGLFFTILGIDIQLYGNSQRDTSLVLKFEMREEVGPALWRKTDQAFKIAEKSGADVILIHMNTYGGMVVSADSIRTRILNSPIPVYVFIDNNAASAGALISVACDRIYMRLGANIGAATVVNQTGAAMPDKYQSYMRSTMRATAEAHGYDTIIINGDTTFKWKRDPKIAEAMVDPDVYIEGIIDTGKVLTFTAIEAQKYGFCEGIADNMQEVIKLTDLEPAVIKEYKPSGFEKMMGFLVNPVFQAILIMVIFGGIYFELQTPGIGFPLIAAITAAVLYFAPLYLDGIAEHWEIALFVVGLVLIGVEIFVIPGFGIVGISGIILAVLGLTLAMVNNFEFNPQSPGLVFEDFFKSLLLVIGSIILSFIGSIWLSQRLFQSAFMGGRLSLLTVENTDQGFVAVDQNLKNLVGKTGVAATVLRPSGKVEIEGFEYDAKAEVGFIDKGTQVNVIRNESGQLYVVKSGE